MTARLRFGMDGPMVDPMPVHATNWEAARAGGHHVLAQVRDAEELKTKNFLENLHAA